MEDIKTLIDQINEEQKELVLKSFTNEEACALGIEMYQKALRENKPIVISITKNRKQIFYAALEGTSKNNEDWVRRKENTVYDFEKSSYEMKLSMDLKQDDLWNRYGLEKGDYAQAGVSIPVFVSGTGMIGTVTVSGMAQSEDHAFVAEALKTLK